MKNSETKDFIAYEYLSLKIKEDVVPMYIDCYENFGWQVITSESNSNKDYYINHNQNEINKINIKFKRDRKIKHKNELNNLQRKMEISLSNIEEMKKDPANKGLVASMTIGLIGTIFMALSVFSITATNPLIIPCIIFGFFGIIGWILPFFVYKDIKKKKETENSTLIDEEYNTLYGLCEQASKLTKWELWLFIILFLSQENLL